MGKYSADIGVVDVSKSVSHFLKIICKTFPFCPCKHSRNNILDPTDCGILPASKKSNITKFLMVHINSRLPVRTDKTIDKNLLSLCKYMLN